VLKEQLELYMLRAQDADPGVLKLAFKSMRYSRNYSVASVQFLPFDGVFAHSVTWLCWFCDT
jgi:hypothetical protein